MACKNRKLCVLVCVCTHAYVFSITLNLICVSFNRKLHSVCEYVAGEQCSYCSACVPFESPEIAFCQGAKCSGGVGQSHKLARCAVCMQVCPASPSWFCTCCQRYSSKLAPPQFFLMPRYPLDFKSSTESCTLNSFSKPFCPFCGILLQRLQPVFLLSASPA